MSFRRHLVKWEEEYESRGLSVIEVSGGNLATFEESERAFAKWQVRHPVLWDRGNLNHQNYGVKSWPSAFLIGTDGKVFWQGNPERISARPEELQCFRSLLDNHLEKFNHVR